MRMTVAMIVYRRLKTSEIPTMLSMWKKSGLPIRERTRDSPKALRAEMKAGPQNFIGAFEGEELVGVVLATSDGRKGWINRLAVEPSHRHKGVALRLIQEAEEELLSRGIHLISGLIEKGNEASFALFAKAGYEITEDVIYVRKELEEDA
jgi:ribosomal protein S18 acetylase RimI-like enzyme